MTAARPVSTDELLVSLLRRALDKLRSVDLLSKDSIPVIREALVDVDDLHSRLGDHASLVFPPDARRRLEAIRTGLRFPDIGDARAALRDLEALAAELRRAGT